MAKTTSKPLPALPETSLTLLTGRACPPGPVREQSAAVKVAKLMARSNVTRTLETLVGLGPIGTALTIWGSPPAGVPTAAAALTMPPEATLPARAEDLSAVARIWEMTWRYVQVGFFDHTSAATPVTNGVAIDVPLLSP